MKLSVVLASCLAGLSAAIAIPKGTSIATIQIPNQNDLRVYYQDNNNYIVESSVGLPTNKAIGAYIIYTGGPRKRTPLASLSYNNSGRVEVN
ncbi:hypothetical protein B0J11DRAFT_520903 [Dendryphion nanum]|uniref:Uncharacterized protein n=1 Tax=Dendryphion nanum TaxID=256645 RepID=A0A9P9E6U3_9PLEO|nr:hypothetical protein B0J11DRAFT_520903 [Dendryphion nanum]